MGEAEIRKNAHIIKQAARTGSGPYTIGSLPLKLQAKIAAMTVTSGFLSMKD